MVAQVQRRVGTTMRVKGRPAFPIPGSKVRDRLVCIMVSAAGDINQPSDPFVLGTTKPDATNTGPRIPFASAQPVAGTSGKITYATAGQVITGKIFNCQVFVTAPDVTFRDCWFLGSTILKFLGASLLEFSAARGTVEFSELTAYSSGVDRTRYWLNAVRTTDTTVVRRNNIHDVTDHISLRGNNWRVQGNYIHHLAFRSDDADHKSDAKLPWWTHGDGGQFDYADGGIIEGNNIEATFSLVSGMIGNPNAPGITNAGVVDQTLNHGAPAPGEWPHAHGLLIGPRSGNITNLQVIRNWFSGGNYGIQITTQGRGFDTGNSGSFSENRLYANQTGAAAYNPAQILVAAIGTFTGISTTIYAEDDLSVVAGWRGKPIQSPSSGGTYRFSSSLTPPN